jgi:hypothetical protein
MWHLQSLPLAPSLLLLLRSIFFGSYGDDEVRRFPLGEPILVHRAIASLRVEGLQQRRGDDVMLEASIAFPSPRGCKNSSDVTGVLTPSNGGGGS